MSMPKWRAAALAGLVAAIAPAGTVWGQGMPSYQAPSPGVAMTPVFPGGSSGVDYSANAPSLAALTLLATIPASNARVGYLIQAQCAAGLTVAFDNSGGTLPATIVELAGPAVDGGQGGALTMAGMPHNGRIRIYSSAAGCQMAARAW